MAARISSQPNTLAAGLSASLFASSVTIAIGFGVLRDVGERCQELERRYLHREQIALLAAEELAREGKAIEAGKALPESGNGADPQAHLARLLRAVHSYQAPGELREEETAQIGVLVRTLQTYRQALAAPGAADGSAGAALRLDAIASGNAATRRAFGALATIAGRQASAFGSVLSATALNITNIYLLIAALGILAGIPPAMWVIHLLQRGMRQSTREFHPEMGAAAF